MRLNIHFALAVLLTVISVTACSAGPTKRYVDGLWKVSENICSSDPDKPDLGDMRSVIRQNESYQTSFERKITMYYLDRTILDISQKFTRGGKSGEMKLFENSSTNSVVRTIKILNTRELNNLFKSGIEEFFADSPNVDGKDAKSFCLFRGQ